MKEINPGHIYLLENYDLSSNTPPYHVLHFMKRIGDRYPGNEPPSCTGTNCQEVIRALIARVVYLDNQFPCIENQIILFCSKIALWAFEFRASRIKGKFLLVNPLNAWKLSTDPKDGHIKLDRSLDKNETP